MACVRKYKIPYKYSEWPRWLKALVNIEIKNLALLRLEEHHQEYIEPGLYTEISGEDTLYTISEKPSRFFGLSDILKKF